MWGMVGGTPTGAGVAEGAGGGVSAVATWVSLSSEQALGSMSAVGVATLGEIVSDAPHATSSRALAPITAGASPRCLRRRTTIKATPPGGLHVEKPHGMLAGRADRPAGATGSVRPVSLRRGTAAAASH